MSPNTFERNYPKSLPNYNTTSTSFAIYGPMKIFLFASAGLLFFTACKQPDNTTTATPVVEEPVAPAHDKTTAWAQSETMSKTVHVTDNELVTITNWTAYPAVATQVNALEKLPKSRRSEATKALRANFNSFKNTIPTCLMIDNVQDAVEDLEKELTTFESQLSKKEPTEKERIAQIKKLQQAFTYLKEKIIQARFLYVDNAATTAVEYLEELNDYNINKTTAHDLRAAAQKDK